MQVFQKKAVTGESSLKPNLTVQIEDRFGIRVKGEVATPDGINSFDRGGTVLVGGTARYIREVFYQSSTHVRLVVSNDSPRTAPVSQRRPHASSSPRTDRRPNVVGKQRVSQQLPAAGRPQHRRSTAPATR